MLIFENPYSGIPVQRGDVEQATILMCQAGLIRVAQETNLELRIGSFEVFTSYVQRIIDDDNKRLSPPELVVAAERFALRGARRMVEVGEPRFHEEGTWDQVWCGFWPFCDRG